MQEYRELFQLKWQHFFKTLGVTNRTGLFDISFHVPKRVWKLLAEEIGVPPQSTERAQCYGHKQLEPREYEFVRATEANRDVLLPLTEAVLGKKWWIITYPSGAIQHEVVNCRIMYCQQTWTFAVRGHYRTFTQSGLAM